jgi:hypothetical protein
LLVGQTSNYSATGGGTTKGVFSADADSRTDLIVSNQTNGSNAGAALVLGAHGHDYIIESQSLAQGSALTFTKSAAERMRIDSSGNVGIGVVPSAFLLPNGSTGALQLQSGGLLSAYNTNTYLSQNWYYNAGEKYIANGSASRYAQTGAEHVWSSAGNNTSGAGAGLSWQERMRIDASGKVGIGTSNPSENLHVEGSMMLDAYNVGAEEGLFFREGFSSSNKYNLGIMTYAHGGSSIDGMTIGAYSGFSVCTGSNTRNERLRIDVWGNLLVGTSALIGSSSAGALHIKAGGGGPYVINCQNKDTGGGANQIQFKDGSGDVCGAIISNATSNTTSYATSSDYRLKENVSNVFGAIEKLKLLQPKTYSFIADAEATLQDGFIAHELATVIPHAVCGEKDGTNEDGSIKSQQVDYGLVTPLLTAALQEAITKIESLTARIAALEE